MGRHEWSVPYAVARGARLAGRTDGHLWYTADKTTFDYVETFRPDPPGRVHWIPTRVHLGDMRANGQIPSVLTWQAGSGRRATMGFYAGTGVINGYD